MVQQLSVRLLRWVARTALFMLLSWDFAYSQTYCNPVYTSGCPFSNLITNVSINTLNHSPANCTTHDFTSLSTSVAAGIATAINVTSSGYCSVGVAIDLNSDGDFDDAGELLAAPAYIANFIVVYNMTITIPAATPNGSYRMRVFNRLANSGNGTPADSPCGTYGYGSWDDYTIIVYHECATISAVTATPSLLCSSGTSSLNVTYTSSIAGTVKWYTAQGMLAGTGNPFTTPVLTASSTYYVAIDNGTCDTPRVPVTVTVVPPVVSPLSVTPADTTICEGKTVKIKAARATQADSVMAANGALTISKTPVNGSSVNSAAELIYTAQELNISGMITNIGFYKKNANTTFNPGNVSVYMKNTTSTTVGATASLTGYSLVYSGPWPNVGIPANTWNNISLTTPFPYEGGSSNLAILVIRTGGASSLGNAPSYRATAVGVPGRSAYYIAGTWTSGVSPMTADTIRPDIKLRYEAMPGISWSPVTALFKDAGLTQPVLATDTASTVYAHPAATTTYNVYSNWNGCLSAGFLSSVVHIMDTVHVAIADTICAGQSYLFGSQTLSISGSYTETFQAMNFCDSVVTLQLTVKPYIYNTVTVNICQGQSYTFNNVTYTTAQTGLKDTFSTPGCDSIVTLNLNVSNNTLPVFSFATSFCEGSTAPLLPLLSNNAIAGTWSPSTLSNTASGSYTFTPSAGQCALPATVAVTVIPNVLPLFNPAGPLCAGAAVPVLSLVSNNGITGTWNPAVVSNAATGVYTFTPAAGQCATTTTLTVTVNPNVTPVFTPISPICSGGTAPVLPLVSNNGITGTWNPAVVSNAATAVYTFTPAAGQCATATTLTVTVNPNVTPVFAALPAICSGAAAPALPLVSLNGITGSWNPAVVSNTATGTYTFTPAAGQCATTATLTVTVNPLVTPQFNPVTPICNGSPAPVLPLTSLNGITGTWTPATVSNTSTGTYTFTPAASFCATTATLTVVVKSAVAATDSRTICANEQPYSWNGIANAVNGSAYTAIAANGCDSVVTLSLTVNPYITHTENVSICQGQSYVFNGSVYNTSQAGLKDTFGTAGCDSIVTLNLTVLPGGMLAETDTAACGGLWYKGRYYTENTTLRDTVKNTIGCDSVFYVTHIRIYPGNPRILVIDTVGCSKVVFEGNTYYSSLRLEDTLRSIHGCDSVKRIININVDDFGLSLNVDPDNPYKGEMMHLVTVANTDPYTVLSWAPAAWFPDQHRKDYYLKADEDGKIVVTGTSINGCTDTAEFTVKVRPVDYGVFMPNAFSPNGDGINDVFGPRFYMDRAYVIRNLSIFNRWGQLVYTVAQASKGAWDGRRNNGNPADAGTYGYFIEIEFLDGKTLKLKGDVTLIR